MIRRARLSWCAACAICVDSVAIVMFTLGVLLSVRRYQARLVLTDFCIPLINHCETFTDTGFSPFIVEVAIGANKLCFS